LRLYTARREPTDLNRKNSGKLSLRITRQRHRRPIYLESKWWY
jgi:hypothetical protein